MVCSPVITHVTIRRIIMGLNKSKKLSKKSIKPTKVEELEDDVEELEDDVEELEDDGEELEDDVEEPVKKARKSMGAKKSKVDEDEDEDDADEEGDEDEEVTFDTDAVVNGIMTDKKSLTSAVYQVQLRLPADIEPMYKGLTPKLKKALRDAFGELIRKAYAQTH